MHRRLNFTNATKAQLLALANTLLVLVSAFGFELSADQIAAVLAVVNAAASLWIGLTYKDSPKRIPDAPESGVNSVG